MLSFCHLVFGPGKSCLGGALVPGMCAKSVGGLGVFRALGRDLENHLAISCQVGPMWVAVLATASLFVGYWPCRQDCTGMLSFCHLVFGPGKSCLVSAFVPGTCAKSVGGLGVFRALGRDLENHLAISC
ncbi:unnamed protein product [Polarella glacialis]|uniref:Uncharacterized protein n=1 Tax=Polarella glacialis TaxID=89957 RepID=A0A813G0F1_POLGL|nr:unnamed protein product [Polarella glacialis]